MTESLALLDVRDSEVAAAVIALQRRSYRVEAELIGFDGIPLLNESLGDLMVCGETFVGATVDENLTGAISYRVIGDELDIHRLMVDPPYFRRGVARVLLRYVLNSEPGVKHAVVRTGAANTPALALYRGEGFAHVREDLVGPGVRVAVLRWNRVAAQIAPSN